MTLHQRINLAVLLLAGLFVYYILFPILYPPLSKVFSKCASVPEESCQQQPYKLVQMGKPRFSTTGFGPGYAHETYIPGLCDQCLSHIDFQTLCYDYFMQDFKARRPQAGQGLKRIDIYYRYISEYEWKSLPEYEERDDVYESFYTIDIDPLLASMGRFKIVFKQYNIRYLLYNDNDYDKKYPTIKEMNERFNKKLVDSLPSGAVPKK